jgi:xyloglucan-specific exo-beta-1,4-glucanase
MQTASLRPAPRLAATCLLTAVASTAQAPVWSWQNANIQAMGFVTGLAAHPLSFDIYARTDVGGIYRLDRATDRWQPLMDALPVAEIDAFDIESIALDPQVPTTVAALVARNSGITNPSGGNYRYGDVMVTTNGGASWTPQGLLPRGLRVGGNLEYRGFSGERLAIDPRRSGRFLVSSRVDGVWVRENVSSAWTPAAGAPTVVPWSNGDPNDREYAGNTPGHTFVVFDRNSAALPDGATSRVYMGDHATGVWRSMDAGRNWSLLPGSPLRPVHAIVHLDGLLYVASARYAVGPDAALPEIGAVHRFDPATNAWTDITPPLPGQPGVRDLRPYAGMSGHPTLGNELVLTAGGGAVIYRSVNRGASWQRTDYSAPANSPAFYEPPRPENFFVEAVDWGTVSVLIDPANPARVFQTNGFGVLRNDDFAANPANFTWLMQNLEELVMHNVVSPPVPTSQGGADFLSACMDMVGLRHERWDQMPTVKVARPLMLGQATAIAYAYRQPQHAAVVGRDSWQPTAPMTGRTHDNGQTWTPFANSSPGVAGGLAMSATNPNAMVWEPSQGRPLYATTDGGQTWSIGRDLDAPFDPLNPNYWQVGQAWHVSNPWWQNEHLAADKVNGNRFYRLTGGRFLYSNDGGQNWRRGFHCQALGANNAPLPFTILLRLVPHPAREGEVWISEQPNSDSPQRPLWRTLDGGLTVQRIPSLQWASQVAFGLGDSALTPFVYVHGVPVGETAEGIWLSRDNAVSWQLVSDPSQHRFARINSLEGDMRRRFRLYAGMNGRGVLVGQVTAITAEITPFGAGCGTPALQLTADGMPVPGQNIAYAAGPMTPPTLAALAFGFSDQNWNGIPLPLALAPFGAAPGCQMANDPLVVLTVVTAAGGAATFPFALPNDLGLLGFPFFTQAYAFAGGPFSSSNALRHRIGY